MYVGGGVAYCLLKWFKALSSAGKQSPFLFQVLFFNPKNNNTLTQYNPLTNRHTRLLGPRRSIQSIFWSSYCFCFPLWLLHSAFVSLPSLCPLEHWLKMNCWLQVAPSMLRAVSHVVTDNSQRVGDGLNCHMVIHTFSLCFHILHPRLKLLLFFHSTSFFLFPPSALLFQTSQKKQRSDGGFFSSLDLTTHGTVEQRERERV